MTEPESSYYPPRARWYGFFFILGDAFRRRLAIDRMQMPSQMKTGEMAASFLVPGLGVWLRGPGLWGKAAMAAVVVLVLYFIIFLGHPSGNLALGALISLHVTGFVYYCQPMLRDESPFYRVRFTLLSLLAAGLLLYVPARACFLGRCLTPLQVHGRVMVFNRLAAPNQLRRGDLVAYSIGEDEQGPHGDQVWMHAGVGVGPVLAVPGDQVEFGDKDFTVNGVARPNLDRMPTSGGLTVPENSWFIWPDLDISGHGNVSAASINNAILNMATVTREQYLGKPFHRWFGRTQF